MAEIAAGNPRFRRMYRFVPMISAEEISIPKTGAVYDLSAVRQLRIINGPEYTAPTNLDRLRLARRLRETLTCLAGIRVGY